MTKEKLAETINNLECFRRMRKDAIDMWITATTAELGNYLHCEGDDIPTCDVADAIKDLQKSMRHHVKIPKDLAALRQLTKWIQWQEEEETE